MGRPADPAARTFEGNGTNAPASIVWDAVTDDGTPAPEGTYMATLSVDYGTTFRRATATSAPFVLDRTPPRGSISLSVPLFSPIEGAKTIALTLEATSPIASIAGWSLSIFDPGGNVFNHFHGTWPDDRVVWDGKGLRGDLVQSAEDYPVVATIRDQFGNVGQAKATISVDILVEKTAEGYFIPASRIFFKSFTSDYVDVAPALARQNTIRLNALAAKLSKFPGYRIKIVGHAVRIYWWDPALGKTEQQNVLIPLSRARAEAIKRALVDRGIRAADLTTDGVGAADQLVPDNDLTDRWQNRRVALYLLRKP